MTETKEKAPGVLRTLELKSFVPRGYSGNRQQLKDMFDEVPIQEVRESCLKELNGAIYEEDRCWAKQRIKDFLALNDFPTALMVLRFMFSPQPSEEVFETLLDVFEWTLKKKPLQTTRIKEIAVVFCGYLKRHHNDYNDRARGLIEILLDGVHGTSNESKEGCAILKRIIPIIAAVGDIELLPLVQSYILPYRHPQFPQLGLAQKFEYFLISEHKREVDALARSSAYVLESILAEAEQSK